MTTVEDAILSKLEWLEMSGSDTQRWDVVEMIIANFDDLNRACLDQWPAGLGVGDLLWSSWDQATEAE